MSSIRLHRTHACAISTATRANGTDVSAYTATIATSAKAGSVTRTIVPIKSHLTPAPRTRKLSAASAQVFHAHSRHPLTYGNANSTALKTHKESILAPTATAMEMTHSPRYVKGCLAMPTTNAKVASARISTALAKALMRRARLT